MTLLDDKEIKQSFLSIASDLSRALRPGLKIARMPDGSITTSGNSKHLLRSLVRGGDAKKTFRSIIIDACRKSESIGPGSSLAFVDLFIHLLDKGPLEHDPATLASRISQRSRPPTIESIRSIMELHSPDVVDLVIEAITIAGSECKIFVEPSVTRQTMVERVSGHNFRCDPDPSFFKNGKWTAYDVKCLVIDGIVEKISEIDSLLQRCNVEKRPMAIFARGFDRDVISTLRVNYARKTLNVIPITVEFDLETANVLLDIATVMGSDVTSSLKGELISTIKFDDIVIAKSIICAGRSATVTSTQRSSSIDIHVKNLISKRRNETLPAVKQIIDQRLRSLSPASVIMRVDDSGPGGGRVMHEIDEALRLVRSILTHGVMSRDEIDEGLRFIVQGNECPTAWLLAAVQTASSLASMVSSIRIGVSAHA